MKSSYTNLALYITMCLAASVTTRTWKEARKLPVVFAEYKRVAG